MHTPTVTLAAAVAAALCSMNASAATCADLAKLTLPDTKITTAESVSGTFAAPGVRNPLKVPSICRVAGVVSPAIKFEVWLPESSAWNGRFQAVGGGGLAGIISYPALAEAVNAGYASTSTDTGHEATDNAWLDDRQRVIDYGYRAIHEMTVKAKAVIDAYYGKAPQYSYFNGCSTGGRQGLMEAQRFPNDYDGIISGAPVEHVHAPAHGPALDCEGNARPAELRAVARRPHDDQQGGDRPVRRGRRRERRRSHRSAHVRLQAELARVHVREDRPVPESGPS